MKKLNLDLPDHNIDRTHRIGTVTPTITQPRPIIVILVSKNKVFKYFQTRKG